LVYSKPTNPQAILSSEEGEVVGYWDPTEVTLDNEILYAAGKRKCLSQSRVLPSPDTEYL
jgi:hypothetical protein